MIEETILNILERRLKSVSKFTLPTTLNKIIFGDRYLGNDWQDSIELEKDIQAIQGPAAISKNKKKEKFHFLRFFIKEEKGHDFLLFLKSVENSSRIVCLRANNYSLEAEVVVFDDLTDGQTIFSFVGEVEPRDAPCKCDNCCGDCHRNNLSDQVAEVVPAGDADPSQLSEVVKK